MRNLFGNDNVKSTKRERSTLKNAFRKTVGYNHDHECGTCKKCVAWPINGGVVYKCRLLASSSTATDIKTDDVACRFYEAS